MITIRQATVADLFSVELQENQRATDPRAFISKELTDEHLQTIGAWAMEKDGKVIACYGATPCQPGVAEAWAMLSEESLRFAKSLAKDMRKRIEWGERECGIRRTQATAREGHEAAHRWLQRLGFVAEGRMRAFGIDGEAHWLYGRVSPWAQQQG